MTEQAASGTRMTKCPACAAVVYTSDPTCWLCQQDLHETIIDAELVEEPPHFVGSGAYTQVALIVGVVLLALVTAAVFLVAPGIGGLVGVVFLLATFAAAQGLKSEGAIPPNQVDAAQAYASPKGIGDEAREFPVTSGWRIVAQIFTVFAIVGLLGLGAVVALFVACLVAFNGMY